MNNLNHTRTKKPQSRFFFFPRLIGLYKTRPYNGSGQVTAAGNRESKRHPKTSPLRKSGLPLLAVSSLPCKLPVFGFCAHQDSLPTRCKKRQLFFLSADVTVLQIGRGCESFGRKRAGNNPFQIPRAKLRYLKK